MMKLNQRGSAVLVILVLILVVVVGGVGYMVYSRQSNSKANSDTSKTASSSQDSDKATITNIQYLEIKEWGVKMKVEPELGKVSYKYKNENGSEKIIFSSDFQQKLPDSCAFKADSPWGIAREVKPSAVGNEPIVIDGKNYRHLYPQSGCEDAADVMAPLSGAYNRSFITLTKV